MKLVAGSKVKNYVLDEPLGKGASGEVWKANDGSKFVAIKFMNEHLMQGDSASKHRARLEREVQALTQLQHPNIPTLYDYDLNFQRPYLVMRYVGGETYDHLIASGQMLQIRLDRRLEMLRELAMALTAAHELGIVHRDIKPSNMTGIESPYLLDFSIALRTVDLMSTMLHVGTALYMDYEDPPDALSDIFSFALVAYEMLFGVHAIFTEGSQGSQMIEHTRWMAQERIKNREWRIPSRIPASEVPPDLRKANFAQLDRVFEKAFSPREQRYRDARQFVEDLKAAVQETNTGSKSLLFADTEMNVRASLVIPSRSSMSDQYTVIEVKKAEEDERKAKLLPISLAIAAFVIVAIIIFLLVLQGGG